MKPKWYMLLVTVALIRLSGVHSQPPTPVTPEIFCKHFLHGYPLGAPLSNDLIIRDCYALSNNDTTKFADWVCCYLTCHEVDGDLDLERNWKSDPWLLKMVPPCTSPLSSWSRLRLGSHRQSTI